MDSNTDSNNSYKHQFLPVLTDSGNGHYSNGYTNGHTANGESFTNGHSAEPQINGKGNSAIATPIAICGMACRLPGEIYSPEDLWKFLLAGHDARSRVPESRYNISTYYSPVKKPDTIVTEHGYFLGESVDLGALDTSFFSMPRTEVERLDPQQRMLLEVARESLEDSCEVDWKGQNIGVYCGTYGQDWYDVFHRETQKFSAYQILATHDFMVSERVSHELDLRGPSVTFRTACSSSLIALNDACMAIDRGDCKSAIIGGTNIVMSPAHVTGSSEQGVFSPDGSCKTFSAEANGYARGEGIVAIYVKRLSDAIRDGNPIRAVISGTATNFDGKTSTLSMPSAKAQEALIRRAYEVAGISDVGKTALFECHGTGTKIGDPIETDAVAAVFGESGIHISSIKPNIGHAEGAAGLTSLIKAVLALEHQTIPPNIKFFTPNPKIPWESAQLKVPIEPTPWPAGRAERVSINSFGIGGANAHCIIESAASFNAARTIDPNKVTSDTPQLLVFSANTSYSLKEMVQKYQTFLDETPEALADIAYSLANRRQHLPHKSFIVASKDGPGIPAPMSSGADGQTPSLVMVFTGQGSQWPRMGRELLRSNPVFRHTIKSLDKYLQTLDAAAPTWIMEEELLKPARTSRVNEAEFSQPLCTAIQLGLVDALASVGIKPAAVVGHSSGEIGAAYAAGALTAEEAIKVAFFRGTISKLQTKSGGMAAVGLSWEEAHKHLVPGVVVACDNSHNGVTLSGDADKLEGVVNDIKNQYQDILATTLKVEKAYHSHHMVEVGPEYCQAMISSGVVGKGASIPFFSSVTGDVLTTTAKGQLGPKYWQQNLECPVRFKGAVCSILRHPAVTHPVFLEVGAHAALAGPLRQILTHESSKAPYLPTLIRRQNGVENFLTTIGKLYTLNVPVDFKAMMPTGSSVPGLPSYPWDHQRSFWYESRVSREWRQGGHPYHDLLGRKLPESTELEPVWRNLLHLNNVPWIADYKIDQGIVYPFSAFVAMAAEAIQQITGIQDTVGFRHVSVSTALLVSEDSNAPTELVTVFHHHRLTESLDSEWWDFTISSHNGHVWTKHCSGEVRAESKLVEDAEAPKDLPRKVSSQTWYDAVRRRGLDYGHHFQSLEQITSSTTLPHSAKAKLQNNWHGDEANYHLHPVILESYFQLLSLAVRDGRAHAYRRLVPTSVESLTISRCRSDDVTISTIGELVGDEAIGQGSCISHSKTVLKVSGTRMALLEGDEIDTKPTVPITARSEWVPCIDFEDMRALVKPQHGYKSYGPNLEELTRLAISFCQRSAADLEVQIPHLQKYKAWLNQQDISPLEDNEKPTLRRRIDSLVEQLAGTPAAPAATAIAKVCTNVVSILSSEKKAFETLNADETLSKLDKFMKECDYSTFFQHLGHSKPNIRVLEVGAGSGAATAGIMKHLMHAAGQPLYSQYVFTDVSTGLINAAKERFKAAKNMEFSSLDISKDLADYGFEDRQFDLIIATGVLHDTPNLQQTLSNVYKLLTPSGRLLLQEPLPEIPWTKFILGTLPSWWCGINDNRAEEPYITLGRWEEELAAAEFEILDTVPFDINAIVVAKPRRDRTWVKKVTVLCSNNDFEPSPLIRELESRGYEICRCTLQEKPPHGQDIISLLDLEGPFLEVIDKASFESFKAFIDGVGESGIFWVTQPCQMHVRDPRYAPIIGLSRTMRNEMAVDFATCEIDDFDTPVASTTIADIFRRFQQREKDGVLGPDFEYAVRDGVTLVNRIFPFPLDDDLQVSNPSDEKVLSIGRPGRLDSLTWSAQTIAAPQGNEVEVEVYAVGLNFKDIMVAMGLIKLPETTFGYEAAGIVRRVGPNVTKFRVGDRVVHMGVNTFSTAVTATEMLFERIPDNMSFTEGAAIPLVYAAVIYSLIEIGRLSKGQSVLIHSAAGGVGLAAIQIARMLEADLHVTVSSDEKACYLVDTFGIPRNRIYNSRCTSFVDDLMRETRGKGVDLALNSLSGELLHATWTCVAKWGTMIEIGKRDLLGAGKLNMEAFLDNRSYRCVDMDQMSREKPQIIDHLLHRMMEYFYQGHIKPIPLDRVTNAAKAQETFRYMQQGKHIGKIVFELRDSTGKPQLGEMQAAKKATVKLDGSASYLLVGGLGGLGRSISIWMIQHGARNLTFLSRSAGSGQHDQEFVQEIESMGCTAQLIRGSVTNLADVARAVDGTPAPLKGIIQMSMALRDQAFPRMTIDDWNYCMQPKVQGTWNLHEITRSRGADLEFFVLFSSLSGIVGQTGQANYAAANTFLDAFVQYRESMHLPCTCITLGAMEGVGFLTANPELLKKMQGSGWRPNQEVELLEALNAAMVLQAVPNEQCRSGAFGFADRNRFILGIAPLVPLSSPDSYTQLRQDVRMAVWHNIGNHSSASGASSDILRPFLASAKKNPDSLKSSEAVALLGIEIGKKLFSLLLKPEEGISISLNTAELGLDSMVAVEVRAWWKLNFGFDITMLEMLSMGTLEALGKRAADGLLALYG